MATTEKPLAGKRIVITRAPEQARELIDMLEKLGATTLSLPTVNFEQPDDWSALDTALQRIAEFDWLLFTSQNAVRFFSQRCRAVGVAPETLVSSKLRIASVGPATSEAAEREGMRVGYTAQRHDGHGLVDELRAELHNAKVLLPRSDRADGRLPQALRDNAAEVTEAVVYRTMATSNFDVDVLEQLHSAKIDAIIFASPSAFYNLRDLLDAGELSGLSSRVTFAAIGPTTARAIREARAIVGVETSESTAVGLALAIANHYEGKVTAVRRS